MQSGELSIGELADRAGLSRRAIRFYVQQKLLPAPEGRGRGRHYDGSHLERLRRIAELQAAGHSLDAIRRILDGGGRAGQPEFAAAASASPTELRPLDPADRPARPRSALSAELWTRLRLMEGVELHFDTARHQPDVASLLALRDAIRAVFLGQPPDGDPRPSDGNGSSSPE